jgi:hypothetical protein
MADESGRVPISAALQTTLLRAREYAAGQSHPQVLLEHLLLALTEDPDAAHVLAASRVDAGALRSDIAGYIGNLADRLPPGAPVAPAISQALTQVLKYTTLAAQKGRRQSIDGSIVLAALVGDGRSMAASFLKAQGLTFETAIRVLSEAARPAPTDVTETAEPTAPLVRQAIEPAGLAPPPPAAPGPTVDLAPPSYQASRTDDLLAIARERVAHRTGGVPGDAPLPLGAPAADARLAPQASAPEPETAARPAAVHEATPAFETPAAAQDGITEPPPDLPEAPPTGVPPPDFAAGSARPYVEPRRDFPAAPPGLAGDGPPPARPAGPGVPERAPPAVARGSAPPAAVRRAADPTPAPVHGLAPSPAPPPATAYPDPRQAPPPYAARPQPPAPHAYPGPAPAPMPETARANPTAPSPGARAPGPPPHPAGSPPPHPAAPPGRWAPPPSSGHAPHPSGHAPHPSSYAPPRPPGPQPDRPRYEPPPAVAWPDAAPAGRPPSPPGYPADGAGRPPYPPPGREPYPGAQGHAPRRAALDHTHVSHSVSRRLRQGRAQTVEVRVERPALTGAAAGGPHSLRSEAVLARAISVRLRPAGSRVTVDLASPETVWDQPNGSGSARLAGEAAVWRFVVTPQAAGRGLLQLAVTARTIGADGVLAETQLPDQTIEIRATPDILGMARRAGGVVLAVLLGMLAIKALELVFYFDSAHLVMQLVRR